MSKIEDGNIRIHNAVRAFVNAHKECAESVRLLRELEARCEAANKTLRSAEEALLAYGATEGRTYLCGLLVVTVLPPDSDAGTPARVTVDQVEQVNPRGD